MPPTYPRSRTRSNGQCGTCRLYPGDMTARATLALPTEGGDVVRLLQWTCNLCGYTELYDLAVQAQVDVPGGDVLPDVGRSS